MELLDFDYWKAQDSWYILPTINVYGGSFYRYTYTVKKYKTVKIVVAFLRYRVKWSLLTRREVKPNETETI